MKTIVKFYLSGFYKKPKVRLSELRLFIAVYLDDLGIEKTVQSSAGRTLSMFFSQHKDRQQNILSGRTGNLFRFLIRSYLSEK